MRSDLHVHLLGIKPENGCLIGKRFQPAPVFKAIAKVFGFGRGTTKENFDQKYAERLIAMVDGCDLDAYGILALDGIYTSQGKLDRDRTQVMVGNDYCLKVCDTHPKMHAVCSINPQRRDAIDELDRVLELGAIKLIKVLPNSQDFDPACPRYIPFWQAMQARGVALLSHASFEHTIPPANQLWGEPKRLRGPLEQGVTVVAAHCASSGLAHPIHEDFDTWLAMLDEYPTLWGDISAMASISRGQYIRRVLKHPEALSRVIFGSDYPVPVHPMLFARHIGVRKASKIAKNKNPLQQQVEVMSALGLPEEVLTRGAKLIGLT